MRVAPGIEVNIVRSKISWPEIELLFIGMESGLPLAEQHNMLAT